MGAVPRPEVDQRRLCECDLAILGLQPLSDLAVDLSTVWVQLSVISYNNVSLLTFSPLQEGIMPMMNQY